MKVRFETKPKLIKNPKSETIEFVYYFPIKKNYKNSHYIRLLDYILMTTTKKYNNANELEELKKEKLLIGNNLYLTALSKKFFIVYSFVIPKEKVIKDYNIEEAFKLAISLIKEPFVENKKFNLEKFNYEKDYFVEGNRQSMENKINQMYEEFYKIIDKKEELGCSYEKSAKYLEQITPKKLYQFYEKNIKKNKSIKYVYGDITEKKVNELFEKYYPYKEETIELEMGHYRKISELKKVNVTRETTLEQNYLFLGYQVKNFKKEDVDYLRIILGILDKTPTNLIFEKTRVEKNIVYETELTTYVAPGIFIIKAGLDEKNKQIFIETIKEIFEELKNKEKLKSYIEKLIKNQEINILKEEDYERYKLINTIYEDMKEISPKKILEIYQNVNIDILIQEIKKIELKSIVFFRSTNDKNI